MEEVAEYAKKKKISKNKVIEIALKKLLEEEIRNELIESFKKIADDPDMIEMAEWGMEDYAEQLKSLGI
ncbi:MAG: CopG family transcriptional regulator [Bacteroidota bacterium]|nr:CopG family transcriptional regulator [Bacteroidota bacterium]MDQ6889686.1 CopG family transcriptional regulator [Bacteroidota bacterium]